MTQSAPRPRHAAVPLPGVGKFLAKAFAVGFFGKTKDLSLLFIEKKITECGEGGGELWKSWKTGFSEEAENQAVAFEKVPNFRANFSKKIRL